MQAARVTQQERSIVSVRSHPDCLAHVPGLGHPETPHRVRSLLAALAIQTNGSWDLQPEAPLPPEDDTLGVIRWLHDPEYITRVQSAAVPGHVDTPDCQVSKGTFAAARAAAGLAIQAALDLVNGRLQRAFLALRPPGHHAESDRAMGFCFFNNIALAAEVIVRAWNAPVLIVDFDVHHGNGTQNLFYSRPDVGYLSVHRYPFYPGTGAGSEIGTGAGTGFTRNVPLAVGANDDIYATALETALDEIAARLQPAVILVSAGFDAHEQDPLGGMRVTGAGFERMTQAIMKAAQASAGGRVLSILEGGYDLASLAESVALHIRTLGG